MKNMSAERSVADSVLKKYPQVQELYDKARVREPQITKMMENISEALGNSMAGLAFSVKEASHVEIKIEADLKKELKDDKNATVKSVADKLGDLVRYTQISPHDKIAESTRQSISMLEKEGCVITDVKNFFAHPKSDTGYKGPPHQVYIAIWAED